MKIYSTQPNTYQAAAISAVRKALLCPLNAWLRAEPISMTLGGYTSNFRYMFTVEFDAVDLELFLSWFAFVFLASIYRDVESLLFRLYTIYLFWFLFLFWLFKLFEAHACLGKAIVEAEFTFKVVFDTTTAFIKFADAFADSVDFDFGSWFCWELELEPKLLNLLHRAMVLTVDSMSCKEIVSLLHSTFSYVIMSCVSLT